MAKLGHGYSVLFRLKKPKDLKKTYGRIWWKQEPVYDKEFKACMLVFDTRLQALRFQRRLVALLTRKKVAGRVWLQRFHFTMNGVGLDLDVGPARYERKQLKAVAVS